MNGDNFFRLLPGVNEHETVVGSNTEDDENGQTLNAAQYKPNKKGVKQEWGTQIKLPDHAPASVQNI